MGIAHSVVSAKGVKLEPDKVKLGKHENSANRNNGTMMGGLNTNRTKIEKHSQIISPTIASLSFFRYICSSNM